MIDVFLDKGDLDSAKNLLSNFSSKEGLNYELPYLQGRYAALVGNNEDAKAYLRDALTIIEETRSGFSIPSLRSNYLGNKNYVYETLIDVLLRPQVSVMEDVLEAYNWNELARSRNF